MKIRRLSSILVFLSAYSPLSVIFLIQDFNIETRTIQHPKIILPILGISFISILVIWLLLKKVQTSTPPVTILSFTNKSGGLLNYSIPYMISFIVMDLSQIKLFISFLFFMIIMYILTDKTHNIFINPIFAIFGYNIYDVKYKKNNTECQSYFLIKGERPNINEHFKIVELSENLFFSYRCKGIKDAKTSRKF